MSNTAMKLGTIISYTPHRVQVTSLRRYSVQLIVVPAHNCDGCYFKGRHKCKKPHRFAACTAMGRSDNTCVKFVIYEGNRLVRPVVKDPQPSKLSMQLIVHAAASFQDIPDSILDEMDEL